MEILYSLTLSIIPFLLVLSVLIFVHELGHYLVARYNGVKVEVFSIGFGKELFGWTGKTGTHWKISMIPLGGYVKMFSDVDVSSKPDMERISKMTEEEKKVSFFHKTVWQRIQISAAGPIANYIFAILLLIGIFSIMGTPVPSDEPKVGMVMADDVAHKAGVLPNDIIYSINGLHIKTFEDLRKIVSSSPGKELIFFIRRENKTLHLKLIPSEDGKIGIIAASKLVKRGILLSSWDAIVHTFNITITLIIGLYKMIIGSISGKSLMGVIGIAKYTADVAQVGFLEVLSLTALLSINLGFINLLPIPVLDGGHLLFFFIELIKGKPLSAKAQEIGFKIGLFIILSLVLFSTWNDIQRLQWVKWLIDKVFNFF